MIRLRTLIVDDSRLARDELKTLLAGNDQIEIVAEADDVDRAVAIAERVRPDLILLDIQLPQGSGFDVLERLSQVPAVVFCTAYDQFAVRAFKANALDYLLKPVEPARLEQAVQRALAQVAARAGTGAGSVGRVLRDGDRVFLRDGERCWFVDVAQIERIVIDGSYAHVHFSGQRALIARSLAALEERLDPELFFRASRTVLVNLRQIERVDPAVGDGYTLRLRSGAEIDVSRRQARSFRERLSL